MYNEKALDLHATLRHIDQFGFRDEGRRVGFSVIRFACDLFPSYEYDRVLGPYLNT